MRVLVAAVLGCVLDGRAHAQPRPPATHPLLEAPVFTMRPQTALSAFLDEGVDVVIAWRPVPGASHYRVALTNTADHKSTEVETVAMRWEGKGLAPGRYELTVVAIDTQNTEGAISDVLPINVIEVHAVPPGADRSMAPTRGAYAVGTRFSVPGMHCEAAPTPIDDLLVLPENDLRVTKAGLTTLYCGGIPGYLEKQVVIAPLAVASTSLRITRGATTTVHVTFASIGFIGPKLDVNAFGDITASEPRRTDFGLDVDVAAPVAAKSAGLTIQAGTFELGRIELALVDAPPPPPPPPPPPLDWQALDFGGQVGVFFPSSANRLGDPMADGDVITSGPLAGVRLGFFPIARVGLEGEVSLAAGGYADESGVSKVLATRAQLAVRAVEAGRLGLRLIAGAGGWTTLQSHGTAQPTASVEIHGGAALTVETSPNLWLRFQLADLVSAGRDDRYAHVVEAQLGIFTRFGRRDSF